MQSFFLLVLIAFISSCGMFAPNGHDVKPYITGENLDTQSPDEIKVSLTKIGYMAGGQYEFQVNPITTPLVNAEVQELKKVRGLTEFEGQQVLLKRQRDLLEFKTCFEVQISIVRFKEVSQINKWKLRLVDAVGNNFPLTWRSEDLTSPPIKSYFNGLYGQEEKFLNEGIACAQVDIKLEDGFRVELEPTFVQWPFPNSTTLTWGLPEATYQEYRGY